MGTLIGIWDDGSDRVMFTSRCDLPLDEETRRYIASTLPAPARVEWVEDSLRSRNPDYDVFSAGPPPVIFPRVNPSEADAQRAETIRLFVRTQAALSSARAQINAESVAPIKSALQLEAARLESEIARLRSEIVR